MNKRTPLLPVTARELRGQADVILVTGDAYVDHPAFGAALVGRWLASQGVKVGVIAQPDWHGTRDFKRLGRPGLFFGVTAGCVDSMVANRTALGGRRRRDDLSPGGRSGLRPDRACVVYANRLHQAFRGCFIVLGGIEASTRRFAHYDGWEDRVRMSILADSGADLIAYGAAEDTLLEIARWLRRGGAVDELFHVPGIAFGLPERDAGLVPADAQWIPGYEEVAASRDAFLAAHLEIKRHAERRTIVQPHEGRLVVQTPPVPLRRETLDRVYGLPFSRRSHPGGDEVPGLKVVQTSLTAHRGCIGDCAFCVLGLVQRRRIASRSAGRILEEARWLARQDFFRGTITDVGGPTANMYGLRCRKNRVPGCCNHRRCLFPETCANLVADHAPFMALIGDLKKIPGVRHVYINSGVRFDLIMKDPGFLDFLFQEDLIEGQLSVAPEHVSDPVLRLMRKPPSSVYREFESLFEGKAKRFGKKVYLSPYFISAFPGAALEDAFLLGRFVQRRVAYLQQIQDFTPTPLSDAACMYHVGRDLEGRPIHVARTRDEKLMQRALVQFRHPRYRAHAARALALLGRTLRDLAGRG